MKTNFNQRVNIQHQPWVHEMSVGHQEPLAIHNLAEPQPLPKYVWATDVSLNSNELQQEPCHYLSSF